jgi:hypothetical protein
LQLTKTACIAQGPGSIRSASPFGGLGSVAAVTPAWRCRSLRWLVRHEFRFTSTAWEETHSSTLLWVWPGETASSLGVIAIVALNVMLIAIHSCISQVLGRFDDACLMVEHDFSHPLQRHLYFFAVFHHVLNLVQPGHRLWGHADPLGVVGSMSVDFAKVRDTARTFSHLKRISVETVKHCYHTYLVERRFQIETLQMPLY